MTALSSSHSGETLRFTTGSLVQLPSELAKKLQVSSRLRDRGQGGPQIPGLLRTLQDVEGMSLQVPYLL
jgi:hypothetical protein